MNLVDCYVTEVLSQPYERNGLWCVDVKYNSWGHISRGKVFCVSEEEARKVSVGYKFQS
jgi:hypothetical protein